MSSAGKIGPLVSGATTITGTKKRLNDLYDTSTNNQNEVSRKIIGIIQKVHEEKLLIKVYNKSDGRIVANNRWIPLGHSPEEIADKFGTVRPGMIVEVETTGIGETISIAKIIMEENQEPGTEDFQVNEMLTGIYEIFKPGV